MRFATRYERRLPALICSCLSAALICTSFEARAADGSYADDAAKQAIFASPAWQQAMTGLDEWFTVQVIYPPSEIPKLKREIVEKCNRMSAAELQNFLNDLQQKLAILESPEAIAVRSYIAYDLNVASDAMAAKIRSQLPDVLNMNALQVKQALYNAEQQEAAVKDREAAFEVERRQQVKMVQRMNEQTAQASAAAAAQLNSAPAGGGYSPGQFWQKPTYNPAPIIYALPWAW